MQQSNRSNLHSVLTFCSQDFVRTVRDSRWQRFYLLGVLLFLVGCNMPWGIPEPTTKSVRLEDISGTWGFDGATLELNADGTFRVTGSHYFDGYGEWGVQGGNKNLLLFYANNSGAKSPGYVIDAPGGRFGIFGGDNLDPDIWSPLKRIEPP
jgi:hypothetical protein